ncbi:MAG: type pilus assembly protein PilB [Frankiaceae bacterium]|nr:type pilus assembly protein PilB [Frankiaceae bacterium]
MTAAVGTHSAGDALGNKRLLGEILLERERLTPAQLSDALFQQRVSGKRLGAVLVELGVVDERALADALAEHFSLPVVDLRKQVPEAGALAKLTEATARGLSALPVRIDGTDLEVAVGDPSPELAGELTRAAGMRVRLVVAAPSDIARAIDRNYRALADVGRHVAAFSQTDDRRRSDRRAPAAAGNQDAPVVQVVNLVVTQALRDRASDVHIESNDVNTRVRYRIDGVLHDVLSLPVEMGPAIASRIKVLAGMNIVERRRPQDGQLSMAVDGRSIDIRVAISGTVTGEKVVMRLLDKTKPLFRIDQLGMTARTQARYTKLVNAPFGMVVCAGPTGSGKTTSLYATLTELDSPERNIMTIEDPVEYRFPTVSQIQINEQAGVTFAAGLKAILRQDPDIILVGEVRDPETARIAVQSALTGHFVLSSLHATDATAALHRFLDMDIEPFLIASAVSGVLSQRLVRRICDHCRRPYQPTPDELAFYAESGGSADHVFYAGDGCTFCAETGYSDRVGVYELIVMSPELRQLVVERQSHQAIRAMAISQGTSTLSVEAARLVAAGVTTIAEIIRSIYTL